MQLLENNLSWGGDSNSASSHKAVVPNKSHLFFIAFTSSSHTNPVCPLLSKCEMSSLSESPEEEEVDAFEAERSASIVAPSSLSSSSPTSPPPADVLSASPRKRTQTLPSLGGPPGFRASREPSWERWSYLQETLDEKDEKTFSEDIFKILDLQKVTLFPEKQNSNGKEEGKDALQERRSSNGGDKPAEPPQAKVEPQTKPKENLKQSSPSPSREEIVKQQPQNVIQKQVENTTDQQQLITRLELKSKDL